MFEECNDKVDVLASFKCDGPKALLVVPHYLRWRGRRYKVDHFGMHHVAKRGDKRVHVFGFSISTSDLTVELDPETLEWTVVEVYRGD